MPHVWKHVRSMTSMKRLIKRSWDPKKMNVKFHKTTSYTWNFLEFYLHNHNSCEVWHLFSRTSIRNGKCVTTDHLLHLIKPLKNVKKNAMFFKLFWYNIFVHWKLKLLNFLMDSVLIYWCQLHSSLLSCSDLYLVRSP